MSKSLITLLLLISTYAYGIGSGWSLFSTEVLALLPPELLQLPRNEQRAGDPHYGDGDQTTFELKWVEKIDFNADGRIDVIDARDVDVWRLYLNTPKTQPNGTPIEWKKIDLNIKPIRDFLEGVNSDTPSALPVSLSVAGKKETIRGCYRFNGSYWLECPEAPKQITLGRTDVRYTLWYLTDMNGDGLPDLVFNSLPVKGILITDPESSCDEGLFPTNPGPNETTQNCFEETVIDFPIGAQNQIMVFYNRYGVHLPEAVPFTEPVILAGGSDRCGIEKWTITDSGTRLNTCTIKDINGDNIADHVTKLTGNDAYQAKLGTGTHFSISVQLPDVP
ncbi:MAG: hypothetical protein V3R49_05375 [Gammaproteobacteria bacterium]